MTKQHLTSKELLETTGISRATLNNYVALGILPRPEVRKPTSGDSSARRMGYFPAAAVDTIERVQQLKRTGLSMDEISNRMGDNPAAPDTSITDSRLSYDVLAQDTPISAESTHQPDTRQHRNETPQETPQEAPQVMLAAPLNEPAHQTPSQTSESQQATPPRMTAPTETFSSANPAPQNPRTKSLFDQEPKAEPETPNRRVSQVSQSEAPRPFTRHNESNGASAHARRLTIDNVEGPAYMVNNQYEVEWSNDQANTDLFGISGSLPKDITECNIFPLLFNYKTMCDATDIEEILKFHLAPAKIRIPRSKLYGLGQHMNGEHIESLLHAYDEAKKFDRSTVQHTTVNIAPEGEPAKWYLLHATFFREGIFFTYSPSEAPTENLMNLLGRRDIMIREFLQRRRKSVV